MLIKTKGHTIKADDTVVKEAIVGDGEARKHYVIAYNPQEAERDRIQREQIVQTVEMKLENLMQLPNEAHHKQACFFGRIRLMENIFDS